MPAKESRESHTEKSASWFDMPCVPGGGEESVQIGTFRAHFRDFCVVISGREVLLPVTEKALLALGRDKASSDLYFSEACVSRDHAVIHLVDGKAYIAQCKSSRGPTQIVRGTRELTVAVAPELMNLESGDIIRLGGDGGPEFKWQKLGAPTQMFRAKLYQAGAQDPVATERARAASNEFITNSEYPRPLPSGFQLVSGQGHVNERGYQDTKDRPSIVIDRRPGADPVLEGFKREFHTKYEHMKDSPKTLVVALAKEVKNALEPKDWSNAAIDAAYAHFRNQYAGQRLLLGDVIEAAKLGQGAGLGQQQALLLKELFDSFYPEDMSNRPQLKLVRGYCDEVWECWSRSCAINHSWTVLQVPDAYGRLGPEVIVDPRQQIYAEPASSHPEHHSGKDVPSLRPPFFDYQTASETMVRIEKHPLTPAEVDRLKGRQVRYNNENWRIANITNSQAEIRAARFKTAPPSEILNGDDSEGVPELVIGKEYKLKNEGNNDVWLLIGWEDKENKEIRLFKDDAIRRILPLIELAAENKTLFEELARMREGKKQGETDTPERPFDCTPPSEPLSRAAFYGIKPGREVHHLGRTWRVDGFDGENIDIVKPGIKEIMKPEFNRLNGGGDPNIGQEYWIERSSGILELWKLTKLDSEGTKFTLRSETAFREKVPLDRVLEQNPQLTPGKPLDPLELLLDPTAKVHLESRWSDKGPHDKWIGTVEGSRGERVQVMVHRFAGDPAHWTRLKNDLATQHLARKMNCPHLFPSTIFRDGMMVQAVTGLESENLASFVCTRLLEYKEFRVIEPDIQRRVEKVLESDPLLKAKLAEVTAFSVLLGDIDQQGLNFLVERTGPGLYDFSVARIDTDYAFSLDHEPRMDQLPYYGLIMCGIFAAFSEGELPPYVKPRLKQISDELNPTNETEEETTRAREARAKFVKDSGLNDAQVNALAARAEALLITGKFPRSRTFEELCDGARARNWDTGAMTGDTIDATAATGIQNPQKKSKKKED